MSVEAIVWAKRTRFGSPHKKLIVLVLADYADEAWSCFPGQVLIADQTELGERTVRRLLAELESDGVIRREHRQRPDGSRTSDRIYLAGGTPESTENPTGQQRQPTGQPRQSNRPPVAGHEPSVDPTVEPSGSPLTPPAQLVLAEPSPPAARRDDPLTLVGFDAFWRAFPYKVGKPSARRAWAKAIRRANAADIIAAAERYAADPNRRPKYTKHPGPWLNDDRWEAGPLPDLTEPPRQSREATGMSVLRGLRSDAVPAIGSGS